MFRHSRSWFVASISILSPLTLGLVILLTASWTHAADYFWDTNGATAGSGNAGGSWNTGTNWSTNSGGTVATIGWTDTNVARFSAGTDGIGTLPITLSGNVAPAGIIVEEGIIQISTSFNINSTGGLQIQRGTGTTSLELGGSGATSVTSVGIGNPLAIGGQTGTATLIVSGTHTLGVSGNFLLGEQNGHAGNVNQTGGTVNITTGTADAIRIGHWPTETSVYTISGGTLNALNTDTTVSWDGNGTINVQGGTANLRGVKFNRSVATTTGTLSLTGGTLNIGAGGITDGSTGANVMNITLDAGTLGVISSNWSSNLPMSLTSNTTGTTFNTLDSVDNSTARTISLSGALSGAGKLNKAGAGTLTLTALNTYTGGTTVNQGTLTLGRDGGDGNGTIRGTLTVAAGANVDYSASNPFGYTSGVSVNVLNINGGTVGNANFGNHFWNNFQLNMTGGTLNLGFGAQTFNEFLNPTITVTSSSTTAQILAANASAVMRLRDGTSGTFNVGDGSQAVDLLVTAPIVQNSGTSGITKTGLGTMQLTGANTYTGTTLISAGTLEIGNGGGTGTLGTGGVTNNAALVFNRNNNFTVANVISGSGTVTQKGTGTLTLTALNTYTGGTTVSQGTLTLGRDGGDGNGTIRGTLTVAAGANVDYSASNPFGYTSGASVNVLNINGGTVGNANFGNHFWNNFQLNMTGGTLNLGFGVQTFNEFLNPTITVTSSSTTAQILAAHASAVMRLRDGTSGTFNVGDGSQAIDLLITAPIVQNSGASGITKTGLGTMQLTGANSYTGTTNVNAGSLNFNMTAWSGGAYNGAISVSSGATLGLNVTNGLNYGGNISGAGTIQNNGGNWAYFNGAAAGQFSGFTGTFIQSGGTGYFAFPAGNGAVNAKVQVDGGTLVVGANGSTAGTWEVGQLSGGSGGTILAGQTGSGEHVLQVGALNTSTTYAGTIGGHLGGGTAFMGLTKVGTGTLTLSGNNTYTGTTTVSQGSLTFNGGSLSAAGTAAGSRSLAIGGNSGATVNITNGANLTLGGWVSVGYTAGNGTLNMDSGSLTINGISGGGPADRGLVIGEFANTPGTFNMSGGALNVTNTVWISQSAGATGLWDMSGGSANIGKLSLVNSTGNGTYTLTGGTLTVGAGGIAKGAGAGTATANLGGGTVAASATWSSSLPMNLTGTNGNTTFDTNGNNITLTGNLTGAGGLVKVDNGTLNLNYTASAATYSGGTTVNGGTLGLTGTNNGFSTVGTGTLTINSGASVVASSHNVLGSGADSNLPHVVINGGSLTPFEYLHVKTIEMTAGTINVGGTTTGTNDGLDMQHGTRTITTHASGTSSSIAARISTRISGVGFATFDVEDGAVANDLNISGPIVGDGGIRKLGAGTMNLTGTSTFTGNVAIDAGTVLAAGTGLGANSAGRTVTVNGATSVLEFTGTNVIAANHTTENNVLLVAQNGGIIRNSGVSENRIGNVTLNGGTLTANVSSANWGSYYFGTVNGGSNATISVGGTAPSFINGAGNIRLGGNTIFNVADATTSAATDLTVSALLENQVFPAFSAAGFTKQGPGTMELTGAAPNTFTGAATVSGGVLKVSKDAALGTAAGNTSVSAGASLELLGGLNYATAEPLSLNGAGFGAPGNTGALFVDDGGATTTFAGPITIATNATLGAFGGSTLTLTGNIDKNGTTVTFLGNGAATNTVNINGGVSGVNPNSDLDVDNVTVNVNSAMNYNGPTSVRNGGILNINNGGSATTTVITVGSTGTGTVNQFNGGNTNVSGNVQVNSGSSYNQSGGTATVGGDVNVSGTYAQSGGTHSLTGASSDLTISGAGQYNLSGGTLDFNDYVGAGAAWTPNNSSQITTPTGAQFSFTGGDLVDVSHIVVSDSSPFTQSGGNFYVGRIAAGPAAQTTIEGGFELLGGVLRLDVFGDDLTPDECCDGVASNNDQLTVAGEALLDSAVSLNFVGGYEPEFGDVLTLICAEEITLEDGFFIDGGYFRVVPTGDPNNPFALQAIVPEPASIAVWTLIGLVGAAASWRVRSRRLSRS